MREWLIKLRKASGLSQAQIAANASIAQSHYSNIENGVRTPSVNVAKRLAIVLNFHWTNFYETAD